jgi:hypothetical protein
LAALVGVTPLLLVVGLTLVFIQELSVFSQKPVELCKSYERFLNQPVIVFGQWFAGAISLPSWEVSESETKQNKNYL